MVYGVCSSVFYCWGGGACLAIISKEQTTKFLKIGSLDLQELFKELDIRVPRTQQTMDRWLRGIQDLSRGTFPILSRDPSFQETIKHPGEAASF